MNKEEVKSPVFRIFFDSKLRAQVNHAGQHLLLACFIKNEKNQRPNFGSNKYYADLLGVKEGTIQKYFRGLNENHWIYKYNQSKRKGSRFEVNRNKIIKEGNLSNPFSNTAKTKENFKSKNGNYFPLTFNPQILKAVGNAEQYELLAFIIEFNRKNMDIWATNADLSEFFNIGVRAVNTRLSKLEKLGLIEVTKHAKGGETRIKPCREAIRKLCNNADPFEKYENYPKEGEEIDLNRYDMEEIEAMQKANSENNPESIIDSKPTEKITDEFDEDVPF
jgi:hypothetical protein